MTNAHALEPALVRFAHLLERRIHCSVPTSEDDVRYTFFFALHEKLGLMPEDIILEGHHGTIAGAKLDTRIPVLAGTAYTIEFKYDRSTPSRQNQPRSQKAGQVLKDLFRLAQITSLASTQAMFVYLTSSEMAGYFSNPANGLDGLFKLNVGTNLPITNGYLAGRAKTLLMAAGPITPCVIESFFSWGLPFDHQLRVYGVSPMVLRVQSVQWDAKHPAAGAQKDRNIVVTWRGCAESVVDENETALLHDPAADPEKKLVNSYPTGGQPLTLALSPQTGRGRQAEAPRADALGSSAREAIEGAAASDAQAQQETGP